MSSFFALLCACPCGLLSTSANLAPTFLRLFLFSFNRLQYTFSTISAGSALWRIMCMRGSYGIPVYFFPCLRKGVSLFTLQAFDLSASELPLGGIIHARILYVPLCSYTVVRSLARRTSSIICLAIGSFSLMMQLSS